MTTRSDFHPVGRATPVVEATLGVASGLVFGAASAIRRARIFHPDGVAFRGELVVTGGSFGAPLLDQPARRPVIVRLSRGAGVPEPLPDILGLAVRIEDAHGAGAHQDLLMVTSWGSPVLRHVLLPVRDFAHERWSGVLPYRIGGRSMLIGARRVDASGRSYVGLDDLSHEAAGAGLRFTLEIAPITGRWQPVGEIVLGTPVSPDLADALRFNAANTGGGIDPAGVLQAMRRRAYRMSQAARERSRQRTVEFAE